MTGAFPLGPDEPWLEPLTAVTYLTTITRRIHVGTSALVIPYRNPVFTAKALATADYLSGGRRQAPDPRLTRGKSAIDIGETARSSGMTTDADAGRSLAVSRRLTYTFQTGDVAPRGIDATLSRRAQQDRRAQR